MKPQELISKYIQNNLTPWEELEFTKLMDTDKNFMQEVEFQDNLKKVAEQKDDDNFRALLSDIETNLIRKNNQKWWYIAASILVLLGAIYFFSTMNSVSSNEVLFATYFEPYRNISQPVVRGEDNGTTKSDAFKAYEKGEHKKALKLFNILLATKENDVLEFYKANSLLNLNDTKNAIYILEKNTHIVDSFSEKRYWYLALAYIKDNQLEASKLLLEKLLNVPDSEYKKTEAKALFKKLK